MGIGKLEALKNNVQDFISNKSESWQETSKGEAYQELADDLDDVIESIREAVEDLPSGEDL